MLGADVNFPKEYILKKSLADDLEANDYWTEEEKIKWGMK